MTTVAEIGAMRAHDDPRDRPMDVSGGVTRLHFGRDKQPYRWCRSCSEKVAILTRN
jgi:hypothetical protein